MSALQTAYPGEATVEFRAAGTDLSERRRSGLSRVPLVDLKASPDMLGVEWKADGARIGALTTISDIASDPKIAAAYPGLAAAAGGLATPQIRHLATLGGNLAQRSRCWYFRNPQISCLKKGGTSCPARGGNHLCSVAFDLGPCIAPHPSTMAAALLAYDASAATSLRQDLPIAELFGDGSDGRVDNALKAGEVIENVRLPPPLLDEVARYRRAISRTHAEWPLVELVVRATIAEGAFQFVRIIAGGVAPVPLRLRAAEAAAQGAPATAATVSEAAERSIKDASPLPQTGYKLDLLRGLVLDLLGSLVA